MIAVRVVSGLDRLTTDFVRSVAIFCIHLRLMLARACPLWHARARVCILGTPVFHGGGWQPHAVCLPASEYFGVSYV